ncbi:hypothetical protein SAMN05518672_104339 [Chitinophaga sp. CF118]|uniref:collagen-like triple helix repeat-containing protein n=1 Tax=Chitinophaga sp. CF118 TaxID=1884367 RepID=UPI0008E52EAF|nr:collagen-like protein [Chitinophaga sp. CF118]SFE06350.1 hypothetical protein SAMN05518672_104339 [Chitinophaga sp. CF118]
MKKLSGYFFVACMFSVVLGITSCGKDGDAGPKGATGETGPKGDKGDKGDQGDAGVIYSGWLDASYGFDSTGGVYFTDIAADKVTAEVLNTGMVKVYMNFGTSASPVVVSVPYAEETGVYIKEYLLEGLIELVSNVDASTVEDTNGNHRRQVRYVIVPGGTAARAAKAIDWNDYAKVKAYMGWKD